MSRSDVAELVATSAVAACVVGMMLVIGGVIASGLFLPGVVVIGLGLVVFGAAAVLDVWQTRT
ncbi:hypothetical protein BH23GEM10_BH23GEM10_18040 [soil metagenome]